ncbi:MAG: hypothetical protein AAFV53_35710 [Myxococcota bacterium]
MDPTTTLVGVVAIPAAIAAALLALGRLRPGASAFGALAVALAAFAAAYHLFGWPNLPPSRSADYVLPIGLIGLIWSLVLPGVRNAVAQAAVRVLLSTALIWALTVNLRKNRWEDAEALLWSAGLSAAFAAAWIFSRAAFEDLRPRIGVAVFGAWAAASAVAIGATGSATLAQIAGGVAAAVGGAALVVLASPRKEDMAGLTEVGLPMILMLLFSGSLFSFLPYPAAGLLAFSLLPLHRRGWRGTAASAVLIAAGAVWAVQDGLSPSLLEIF